MSEKHRTSKFFFFYTQPDTYLYILISSLLHLHFFVWYLHVAGGRQSHHPLCSVHICLARHYCMWGLLHFKACADKSLISARPREWGRTCLGTSVCIGARCSFLCSSRYCSADVTCCHPLSRQQVSLARSPLLKDEDGQCVGLLLTSYDRTLVVKEISSEEVEEMHNMLSEYHQVGPTRV